jgi:hypothetical protein
LFGLSWGPTPPTCAFAAFGGSALLATPICYQISRLSTIDLRLLTNYRRPDPHDLCLRRLWRLGFACDADLLPDLATFDERLSTCDY